jgi:hypothetical protein
MQTQDDVIKSSALEQALDLCPVLVRLRSVEYGRHIHLVRHRAAFDIPRVPLGVQFMHKPRIDQGLEGCVDFVI